MATMNPSLTGEIVLASEHLPFGASLVVPSVSWEDYEPLLGEFEHRRYLHLSYDSGSLEIVSPLPELEYYATIVDLLIRVYADVENIDVEGLGQTTWKLKALAKGAEADHCYYVLNASRIWGKREIDLEKDPPPDIVIEIDTTTNSKRKFAIYSALLVPEIWTYKSGRIHFFRLHAGTYVPVDKSQFLPVLTGELLGEFIEISKTEGQTRTAKLFRQRIFEK